MKIEVNKKAPAFNETQILIHAPAEKVYKVLSGINDWPKWQTEVTEASLQSPAVSGANFAWKAGGLKIKSRIHTANSPNEFGWTGRMLWIKAIHNWILVPHGKSTQVFVQESLEGWLSGFMQKNLTNGMAQNLYELKLEAEKPD
ncbi:SRPBCC family protein [Sunxiuqinia sp. sy24]|uniref:SRPBCC family protein n=1 Tax=Sunxiuqinia sp. sy24 TaxID=3461495 RepID=UPI0040456584